MKIKIGSVVVEGDSKARTFISPKYYGTKEDIIKLKQKLNDRGAAGMYGNMIDIDYCLWVDFLSNLSLKIPNVKIPKGDYYNPKVPKGAMP